MSTAILIRGNSGSGKSTTAQLLQQKFGPATLLIPHDVARRHATKPNRNDFGEAEMRSWWLEKDLIDWLPETLIPASMSQEDTVEMIYRESQR